MVPVSYKSSRFKGYKMPISIELAAIFWINSLHKPSALISFGPITCPAGNGRTFSNLTGIAGGL
jgi:hypothetical protein